MRHRNYRLFFYGQGISLIGTWMTRIATGWLVYRLTGSAAMLGIVGFAGQIPSFVFAAFAGVWIERMDRRRLLTFTQILACIQSFALAALTLTHVINIPEILALSVLQGLITAFDTPTRHAFLIQMVEGKDDIGSAIALTSSLVTLARLVGPALAGFTIAAVGEGWCFFIDGASYIAVIVSLLMMHVKPAVIARAKASAWVQLREGWSYVSGFQPIRVILSLFALTSLMGMPYTVLLPIFAAQVLHGGPHTLGFLSGAAGFGALISSVLLAVRKSVVGLIDVIPIASTIFGAGLILLGLSHYEWLSVVVMAAAGFGMLQQMAASNTVIQTITTEDKRARVMSYYTMAFIGVTPFGSLLAGILASRIGAPRTVIVTGACCILGSLWYAAQLKTMRRDVQPVFRELGILPREGSTTA
jgi:MFS family permease